MENVSLTAAIGGYFYFGDLAQWRTYINALTKGKGKLKSRLDPASLSVSNMIYEFRSQHEGQPPAPEEHGLLPVQPANVTSAEIIRELFK